MICNASPGLANFARVNRLYNIAQPYMRFFIRQQSNLATGSARLSSHKKLHGLLRQDPVKASEMAETMMSAGLPVRCKTLEIILLCLKNARIRNRKRPYESAELLESSDILFLKPSMLSNPGTGSAVTLLMAARRLRQRRSMRMFKLLINHCIADREIIVASLLYGTLLKDWQAREPAENLVSPETGRYLPHPNTPFPLDVFLKNICLFISSNLAPGKPDTKTRITFKASLQALANLATMLKDQAIAQPDITQLLSLLCRCRRFPDMVWINDSSGDPKQVVAYDYFHDVLSQLINSLPTHPPAMNERKNMLPPIPIDSYSFLLHYALRSRKSEAMAETILDHMIHKRHPPLQPTTIFLNIIVRSGLMLESEVADSALSTLNQNWKLLTPASLPNITIQKEDKYILASRIAHLTFAGQARAVVDLLPIIFPTLTLPKEDQKCSKAHEQDLHESMLLGPVVFTSVLVALKTAGRTDLAEKVWKRAKTAEAMSWDGKLNDQVQPWCLPVLAYTTMIKVYAAEVRKGDFYGEKVDCRTPTSTQKLLPLTPHEHSNESPERIPEVDFLGTGGPSTRSGIGRYFGMEIYRLMKESAKTMRLLVEISKLRDPKKPTTHVVEMKELKIPEPDAPFFNAILDIVSRHPHMPPRKLRRGLRHYRQQYRKSYLKYIRKGVQVKPPQPDLLEVGKDMMAAGFEIPLLYRKFFVGTSGDIGSLDPVETKAEEGSESVYTQESMESEKEGRENHDPDAEHKTLLI